MLKFYILVSRNMQKVARHLKYLGKDEVVFVINTQDKDFENECSAFLQLKNIEYHITKSNGTPARGKNSLLEIFEKSDHDYCVQVDGDDFLTPHGIDLYKRVAMSKNPPDSICLRNQIAEILDSKKTVEQEKPVTYKAHFFKRTNPNYEEIETQLINILEISEEEAAQVVQDHREYYADGYKYVDPEEAHCRVVFFSKKAAKFRFPEEFLIGEDTLHYYILKNEHFRGNLRMVSNDERPATYIYDQTDGQNTVFTEIFHNKNWRWMRTFNKKVAEFKKAGILHARELPKLKIPYTTCILDDLGMAGLADFTTEDTTIQAPANASQKTLEKIYLGSITIGCKNSS